MEANTEVNRRAQKLIGLLREQVTLVDAQGKIIFASEGLSLPLGYSAQEHIGLMVLDQVHPDDLATAQSFLAEVIVEPDVTRSFELRCRHKDGHFVWIELTVTNKLHDPDLGALAVASRDISGRKQREAEITGLNRILTLLSDTNQAIVRLREPQALFEQICRIAVEKGHFRSAWIGFVDPTTRQFSITAQAGLTSADQKRLETIFRKLRAEGRFARDIIGNQPHRIINDVENDPSVSESAAWLRLGARSIGTFALTIGGEFRGLLSLTSSEPRVFNEAEVRLLDEMTQDVAFAIEVTEKESRRLQAETFVEQYARRMEIMHAIDRGIVAADSTEELVNGVLKHLRRLIPCQHISVDTVDWAKHKTIIFAADFARPSALSATYEIDLDPRWLEGFGTGRLQVIDDLHLMVNPPIAYQQMMKEGMRSCLHVLLMANNVPLGALNLLAETAGYFSGEHLEIATEVADQLAIAIQQQRLADALRLSEARYRQVVEDQIDLVCRYRPDFTITFVNQPYADMMGISADEIVGANLLSLLPEEQRDRVRAHFDSIIPNEPIASFENILFPPNRPPRWIQWQDRAVLDEAGQIVEIQAVGRDITERKQAEQAEREQRRIAEALRDSLAALASSLNVDEVLRRILDYAATVVQCDAGSIILFEDGKQRIAQLRGFTPETTEKFTNYYFAIPPTRENNLVAARKAFIVDDTKASAVWISFPETTWIRSSMGTPIESHGEVVGLLIADSASPGRFQASDLENLKSFARYAALALENAYSATRLEQRVAERTAELNDEKERVEAILNSSLDGILLAAPDLRIQRTNPAFDKLANCVGYACIGKPLLDLIDTSEWTRVSAAIQMSLKLRKGQQIETRVRRVDGTRFDAELSISVIDANDQGVDGFVCTVRDITERKQAQAKLAEERNLLRTLIDSLPDFIWIKDREHRFLVRNAARGNRLNWLFPADVIGKTDADLTPEQNIELFREEEEEIFRTGIPMIDHHENSVAPDGSMIWVSTTKVPLRNLSGEIIGLVGASRDITESKQRELQLRYHASLQENVSDAVISTDLKYRVHSWNKAAERIYGWSAEEAVGKSIVELLGTVFDSEEQPKTLLRDFFKDGRWQGEVVQRRRDGSKLDVLASVTLFKDDTGAPFGIVAVMHDITARKLAEQGLRYSASLLEAINDAVISTDAEFVIQSWNSAAERIYGWQAAEVIGKYLPEVLRTKFSSEQERETAVRRIREQRRWYGEIVEYRKDGSEINILGSMAPLVGSSGATLGAVLINHDISDRKEIEQELNASREQEREFQQYLKALHEITIELTPVDQLDDFCRSVVELGRSRLGFDRLALFLYDPGDGAAVGTFGTDAQGGLTDERSFRFMPPPEGLMMQAFQRTERLAFQEQVPLTTYHVPTGIGWNAASALWDGNMTQGWLVADNAVQHQPASKAQLDILALYSLTVGTQLARKRTNAALVQSEANLQAVMNSTSVGIMLVEQDGTIRLTNQLALDYGEMLYKRRLEAGKTSLFDLNLNDREGVAYILKQVFAAEPMHVELVQQVDTRQFAIDLRYDPVITQAGEVIGATVSFIDVSERKQAEIALRDSEEMFRSLVEGAPEAIIISNAKGLITLVNAETERVFQYGRDELIGQPIEILVPEALRNRHQKMRADYANEPRMRRGGGMPEISGRRKDGTVFFADIQLSYVNARDGLLVLSFVEDVTERKRGEEALRESEARYRLLAETVNDVVARVSPGGDFYYMSPSARNVLGYEPEELVGRNRSEFIHPEDAEAVRQAEAEALRTGIVKPVSYRFRHKDGHYVWLEIPRRAIPSQKAPEGLEYIASARDITDRKRAEDALRESETRYRMLADHITDLIVRVDTQGKFEYVSPSCYAMLGYKPDELEGKSGIGLIHPDVLTRVVDNMISALNPETVTPAPTFRVQHKAGHYIWVETSGQLLWLEASGELLGFIVVARDVTQRHAAEEALRQSEELLRKVMENLPVGVWLVAPDGRITFGNPAGREIWAGAKFVGLDSFGMFRGWWLESGQPIEPDEWAATRAVTKGETSLNEEIEIEAFDGTHKYLLNSAIPIHDNQGDIQGAIVVNQDMTVMKLAENTLRTAFEKEKELGELKSRFVSMASHEFRTPLATILSSSEMLLNYRERMDDLKIDRKLTTIANQVKHLTSIVEDVLDLTRMQTGRTELKLVMADLDALCREVVDEFRSRSEIQQTIIYNCEQNPVQFPLDRKLVRQIIINLISNASKYSAPEKCVYVSLEFNEKNAILRVRDEGIGIPEADMRHLFEPFHRAGNVGTISGTGLGLSITKQAVELHEGTIRAESRIDIGSTFTITLPLQPLADPRPQPGMKTPMG